MDGAQVMSLYDFDTSQMTDPAQVPQTAATVQGLTVSPDRKWILCGLGYQIGTDLRLAENFR